MDRSASLTLSIPAPRDRQDSILREAVAPLVRELRPSPSLDAMYFERFNKPDWGLRFHVLGEPGWLEGQARPLVERRIGTVLEAFEFVDDDAEDKWVGGLSEREHLKEIYHLDSQACLDLMEAEARGGVDGSRAQWSLLVVERLLSLFRLDGETRLESYRRGFAWEIDLGRWDEGVFATLDEKYETQEDALRLALDAGPDEAPWGGADAARIALGFLDSVRGPVDSILAAGAAGRLGRDVVDFAVFAAHAHANRLGIHATQEATIRYLVWRARGGRRARTS